MKDDVFELWTSMFLNYTYEKDVLNYFTSFFSQVNTYCREWTFTLEFIKSESLASLVKQCVVLGESSIGKMDILSIILYF